MDLSEQCVRRTGVALDGAELSDPLLGLQGRPAPLRFRVRIAAPGFARIAVARVLMNELGCPPSAAVPATRRAGARVIAENLSAPAARRLRDGLLQIGVAAELDAHLAG